MATNDFLQFATAGGANVEDQATYAADANRTNGNQAGIASSALNNKAVRQANYVSSILAQFIANQTGTNVQDNTVTAQFLAQLNAAIVGLPSVVNVYTSVSGTWNMPYVFFIASGSATSAATYTNNSVTFTVLNTVSSALQIILTGNGAPLASGTLTKASGTGDATISFYAVRTPISIDIEAVGGGAGGSGTGAGLGAGGNGGNTSFGSVVTCNGGSGTSSLSGGAGGTVTISGATGISFPGGNGGPGFTGVTGVIFTGGMGGGSAYGGAGPSGAATASPANPASTNSGSGGGGSGSNATNAASASGGGAGGYARVSVSSPASTYAYSVAAAGAAGGGSIPGGAGAAGILKITTRFQ